MDDFDARYLKIQMHETVQQLIIKSDNSDTKKVNRENKLKYIKMY